MIDAFDSLAALVPDPILLLDGSGRVTRTNKAFDLLVGEGAVGRLLEDVCPSSVEAARALVAACARATGRVPARLRLSTKNGDVALRCAAHRAAIASEHVVVRFIDSNERDAFSLLNERLDLELKRRRDAEAMNRTKDEFLATVSHELRTPLNAIYGWTLTLRRSNPPAEIDRGLAVVERNARAQMRLIDDVLDLSRIVSGKLYLEMEAVNVADVVGAAVDTVRAAADANGIELVVDARAATLHADADRLQQIVWNLLSNAVKFTPKGGRVSVEARRERSEVVITVRDTGQGIRRDMLDAIFEPFRQVDASTTRRHGGLGLGLAIVRHLVQAHGGTIRAESEGIGRGTTFTLRLPMRETSARSPQPAGEPARKGPRLDGVKVLVVDDEADARELVALTLASQGAEVRAAESAAAGFDAVRAFQPDVIVSDIGMPEVSGYTFMERLRASSTRTPAIALTAFAREQDARRALEAGFQRHAQKPIDPAKLVDLVVELSSSLVEA